MRGAGWLVAVLLGIGWWASEWPVRQPVPQHHADSSWRRTSDGWQRAHWLGSDVPTHWPTLHPGVVASLELLLAITALVAFSPARLRTRRSSPPQVHAAHPASPPPPSTHAGGVASGQWPVVSG